MEFVHKPVLLEEVIDGLAIKPDGIYADGTLGGAGHGSRICEKLNAQGRWMRFLSRVWNLWRPHAR